jgi:hypothetical protein
MIVWTAPISTELKLIGIGTAEFKNTLTEETMIQEMEGTKIAENAPVSTGSWIQVTFTLDPEHYRTLWQRAEKEHRTVSGFVRESVTGYLEGTRVVSQKEQLFAK